MEVVSKSFILKASSVNLKRNFLTLTEWRGEEEEDDADDDDDVGDPGEKRGEEEANKKEHFPLPFLPLVLLGATAAAIVSCHFIQEVLI